MPKPWGELVDFAVYHSNDDLFDAVDNLLEFRQRTAAKQKPLATHINPVRYGIKRMNVRTSVSQGRVPKRTKPNESLVDASGEIVDLTGNDIKTERTLDPSTHKISSNDSKPDESLVNAPGKVEETVNNDLLTKQNNETIDPIENDSNAIDDQGVGVDNEDYNDDDYANDEDGKLQKLIENDTSGASTYVSFGNHADNVP
ncbi:hypothetical protein BPAE_0050g00050 [Botrytis paeoniae]|uniref:Uncharacterized protein n=1 Tax=Botrytis paeoniae TaxID=278948 RepID=A0A4Z1FYQ6_9HELO|nr:hypothetical protein BPAE_0050g00050 [Botrytis paeoniae]